MSHEDDHITKIHDILQPITYRSHVKEQPWGIYGLEAFSQGINVNEVGMDHACLPVLNRGGTRGNRIEYVKVKKRYEVTAPPNANPGALFLQFDTVATPMLSLGTSTSSTYHGQTFTLTDANSVPKTYKFSHEPTGTLISGTNICINCEIRDGTNYTKKSTRELIIETIKAIRGETIHKLSFLTSPTQAEAEADPVVVNFGQTLIIKEKEYTGVLPIFSTSSGLLTPVVDFSNAQSKNVWALKGVERIVDQHRHAFYEDIRFSKLSQAKYIPPAGDWWQDEDTGSGVVKVYKRPVSQRVEITPRIWNSVDSSWLINIPPISVSTSHFHGDGDVFFVVPGYVGPTPLVPEFSVPAGEWIDSTFPGRPSSIAYSKYYSLNVDTDRWPYEFRSDPTWEQPTGYEYWTASAPDIINKFINSMQKSVASSVVAPGNDLFNIDQRLEDVRDPKLLSVGFEYTGELVSIKPIFRKEEIPNTARDNHLFHERDRLQSHLEIQWDTPRLEDLKNRTYPSDQATLNRLDWITDGSFNEIDYEMSTRRSEDGQFHQWSFASEISGKTMLQSDGITYGKTPYAKNPPLTNSDIEAFISHYLDSVVNQHNYIDTETSIMDGRIDIFGRVSRSLDLSISPILERQPYGIVFGSYEKYESYQNIIENRFPKRDVLLEDMSFIDQPGYTHPVIPRIVLWDNIEGNYDSDGNPIFDSDGYALTWWLNSTRIYPTLEQKELSAGISPFFWPITPIDPRNDFWDTPTSWTPGQIAEDNPVMFVAYNDSEPIDHHDFYDEERYSKIDNDMLEIIGTELPMNSLDASGNPVEIRSEHVERLDMRDEFRQELYVYQATGYISNQVSRQDGMYYTGLKR